MLSFKRIYALKDIDRQVLFQGTCIFAATKQHKKTTASRL